MIVPTYNEREGLTKLVEQTEAVFREHGLDAELVIVDDNSPDGTGDLADRLAVDYPLQVVHRPGKLGLGTAVMAGFAVARGEVVGVMDGDLSHPPSLIPGMLTVLAESGADMVVGSRYVSGGRVRNWSLSRLLMSRVACLLARPIVPVRDATSGFFLVRREAVRDTAIEAGGFKICLELIVRGRVHLIVEMPYKFTRSGGRPEQDEHARGIGLLPTAVPPLALSPQNPLATAQAC